MTYREISPGDMHAIFAVRVATWHNEKGYSTFTGLPVLPH